MSEIGRWPLDKTIREKLQINLNPQHCDVINESYMHNVPKNSETHFKVVVVSDKFDKQPLIKVCMNALYVYLTEFICKRYLTQIINSATSNGKRDIASRVTRRGACPIDSSK
jgi:stress-induced morphogen